MKGKAIVAMSGGVDSSLAAALMAEQGWQAVGVTLKLMPREDTGFGCCGSPADISDAKRVCEALGIAHYTLNLSDIFEDKVIKPFIDAYLNAQTPNPCVECTEAQVRTPLGLAGLGVAWPQATTRGWRRRLYRAKDAARTRPISYSLTPRELAKVCFPIGGLEKSEVRGKPAPWGLGRPTRPRARRFALFRGATIAASSRSARAPAARRSRPARSRTPPAASWAATRAWRPTRWASARGWG